MYQTIPINGSTPDDRTWKILIFEDDLVRVSYFTKMWANYNCLMYLTDNVGECIRLLEARDYDIIFLDHDMDTNMYAPGQNGTGSEVAEWMSENWDRFSGDTKIYIHSMNPVGANYMHQILPGSILAPGVWKIKL